MNNFKSNFKTTKNVLCYKGRTNVQNVTLFSPVSGLKLLFATSPYIICNYSSSFIKLNPFRA